MGSGMLLCILRESIRFLLIGFVAAWISSIVVRGRIVRLRGCLPFLVFGLVGALAGGYALDALGQSDLLSVAAAIAGAVLALVVLQYLRNA
jgi:uncharacterized membrane protein YeaQ/YmgE (transglycosylase-associated protein family)